MIQSYMNLNFKFQNSFFLYGEWFPRAQPCERTCSAPQSIILTMKMILNTLIPIVVLKPAEIFRSEVPKKHGSNTARQVSGRRARLIVMITDRGRCPSTANQLTRCNIIFFHRLYCFGPKRLIVVTILKTFMDRSMSFNAKHCVELQ